MTGQDIITEIREYLNEPAAVAEYYQDDDILNIINIVYNTLNSEAGFCLSITNRGDGSGGWIPSTSFPWVAGQNRYEMLAGFVRLKDSVISNIHEDPSFSPETSYIVPRGWTGAPYDIHNEPAATGVPKVYSITASDAVAGGSSITVYPTPDVDYRPTMFYISKPDAITLTTSPVFEDSLHNIITFGVCELLVMEHIDEQMAAYFNSEYEMLKLLLVDFYKDETNNVRRVVTMTGGVA